MTKVGVVLSGCGVYDGSEIHESVITLLALDRHDAEVVMMAPNVDQMHVINHLTGEEAEGQSRNVLEESARIARGAIKDMAEVSADQIDALIFPGGFGGAKNLSDFAVKGENADVNEQVVRLVGEMRSADKPIGFICITPAFAAKIFQMQGEEDVTLTIGNDADTSAAIEKMGANHLTCPVNEIAVDEKRKVVSAPAYMYGEERIRNVAAGIEKLVDKVLVLV